MPYLIDTHPVRAQWVAAVMTTVLTAALTWMTEPGSLRAYVVGPLATGIAVFVAMGYLARRRAKRRARAHAAHQRD
jgi:hypothetical protein